MLPIIKAFVNDQLFREKRALILQAAMEQITDTLFDHRQRKASKDKG
jgi:stalled ribosome alternative rescue factor ArfA